jgi:hypothetical protein
MFTEEKSSPVCVYSLASAFLAAATFAGPSYAPFSFPTQDSSIVSSFFSVPAHFSPFSASVVLLVISRFAPPRHAH